MSIKDKLRHKLCHIPQALVFDFYIGLETD